MSDLDVTPPQFNALTDAWLPLVQKDGSTEWASPVQVLCGEEDGIDLDYPRDDFRVYARLLLSALVQALFPAKTKQELSERIDRPLSRQDVEARIQPIRTDFDLFGPTPFLQIIPPPNAPTEGGAAPFVFPGEDIFRSRVPVDAISLPIALVSIFIEQTYAGGAGRGYGAGPAGQPGALTLVDPGTVRRAAWANTLTLEMVERKFAPDDERPWTNGKRAARPRAATGLVAGLFFQPRSIWLTPAGTGVCSFCGVQGPLVRRSPFLPKSELAPKASGNEDLWQHPCAPLAVNSQGIAAIRLNAARPAWTGLAQLLDPLSKSKGKKHPSEGPAPVLQQWLSLPGREKRPRLLVLDFDRDKANVKRRFFESFPLTDSLLGRRETIELLHALLSDAQDVQRALSQALTRAHDDRKQGGLARADAESAFWTSSEAPFVDWLTVVTSVVEPTDENDSQIDRAGKSMHALLRKAAISIFNVHVALSEFDPRKAERVAKARRNLAKTLYPRPKANGVIAASPTQVSP